MYINTRKINIFLFETFNIIEYKFVFGSDKLNTKVVIEQ